MLEREIKFQPCCVVTTKLKIDPNDIYIKSPFPDIQNSEKSNYIIQVEIPISEIESERDVEKNVENEIRQVISSDIVHKELVESESDSSRTSSGATTPISHFKEQKQKTGWKRYIGIFLIIMATMTYSLATLIIKSIESDKHPFTISYWRFQGLVFPGLALLFYTRYCQKKPVFDPIWPPSDPKKLKMIGIIVIRSIIGCTSTVCHIYALKYVNLADASVIAFSCPVFVIVIAHFLGMEKMGRTSIFVTLLTIGGVAIICRPPMLTGASEFNSNMLIGSGLAFMSMILASLVIIILRSLRQVHFSLMMTSYGIFGTIECVIIALFLGVLELPGDITIYIRVFGLVALTFMAQICLIASLKYEEAGPVALIQTTDSIFSFIWQYLAFAIIPDLISLSGASVVILGVAIISLRKVVMNQAETSRMRRFFSFLI